MFDEAGPPSSEPMIPGTRKIPAAKFSAKSWSLRVSFAALILLGAASCERRATASETPADAAKSSAAATPNSSETPEYSYDVVNVFPHDPNAFTQGLIYLKGIFLETTGLKGRSSLRKVEMETGKVREIVPLAAEYFGEGMTVLNGKIFVLTWQNQKGFVYDLQSFHFEKEFSYEGEGWGLTTDEKQLILSDGTSDIRFFDATTFHVTRTIHVTDHGLPVKNLNELEYIHGEIYANIWQTNFVVRIDPATGRVVGKINFSGLLLPQDYRGNTDVLNGIAYDSAGDRLFVTGKNWPKVFEVRLKRK